MLFWFHVRSVSPLRLGIGSPVMRDFHAPPDLVGFEEMYTPVCSICATSRASKYTFMLLMKDCSNGLSLLHDCAESRTQRFSAFAPGTLSSTITVSEVGAAGM